MRNAAVLDSVLPVSDRPTVPAEPPVEQRIDRSPVPGRHDSSGIDLLVEADVFDEPERVARRVSAAVNNTKLALMEVVGVNGTVWPVVSGAPVAPGCFWFRFARRHRGAHVDSLDRAELVELVRAHASVRSSWRPA